MYGSEVSPGGKTPKIAVRMVQVSNSCVLSDALMVPGKVLTIIHNNEQYHLRITSKNKLILTK